MQIVRGILSNKLYKLVFQCGLAGVTPQFPEEGKALSPFFVDAVHIVLKSELIVEYCYYYYIQIICNYLLYIINIF